MLNSVSLIYSELLKTLNLLIFSNYTFFFTLAFGMFSYLRFYASKNIFLISLFFLPSTILHELLHFIVGFLTFAKPVSFSVIPKKSADGSYTLGEVQFSNLNFFNSIPTALAPLLMLIGLYFFDLYYWNYANENIWYFILFVYINFTAVYSGIPSGQDFKVALSNWVGIIFWLMIIWGSIYYFNTI